MIVLWKRAAAAAVCAAVVLAAPGPRAYAAVVEAAGTASESAGAGVRAVGSVAALGAAATVPLAAPALSASALSAGLFAAPALTAAPAAAAASVSAAAPALAASAPVSAPAAAAAAEAVSVSAAPAEAAAAPALAGLRAGLPRAAAARESVDALAADGRRLFDLAGDRAQAPAPAFSAAAQDGAPGAPGALSPASAAPAAAPSAPPPAPVAKKGKTKLPRSLWGLFFGHDILTIFGIELHMISQPFLVTDTMKKSTAVMGMVRNVHTGSMALANLLPMGLLIDKTDFRVLFIGGALIRAALMGMIPLLFLSGHLTFGLLVAIVAINPIFQGIMVTADGAARMAILGSDEKLNKEASAILGKWYALAGIAMPLVGSAVVAGLVSTFGLGGYAVAYGVYAGLLLASIPFYWIMMRDPRDHSEMGLAGFLSFARETGKFMWAVVKGLLLSPLALGRFLIKLARRAPDAAAQAGVGFKERLARSFDRFEATQGFAYILRNKMLSTLISVGAVEGFLRDAMPFVVLPNFIKEAVGVGPHLALPLIGGILATAGGIFGVMLAAESVGDFFSSWFMEGDRGDRMIERFGPGRFYRLAALSSPLFWLMWLVPIVLAPHHFWVALGTVIAVQFVTQLLHGPVGIVMAPVVRREIPDDKLGRVESAFSMVDLFFSAGGALAAGFMLDWFSISTAMIIISATITLTGVLEWMIPKWIFPDGIRPAKKAPEPAAPKADGAQASAAPLLSVAFA